MKISILSMQRVVNYGSVLQAWSLRQLLQEYTAQPVTFLDIQEQNSIPVERNLDEKAEYAVKADYPAGILQKGKRRVITKLSAYNKKLICRFMRHRLHLDRLKPDPHPDVVVIGSDEVFNHAKGVNLQLHGDVQADKIFTYAASCGSACVAQIPEEYREKVQQAMAHFSAVSVRDAATETYARQLYNGDILYHLDPVLTGPLYQRQHKKVPLKKYLLVYAYGQRIRTKEEISAIEEFAHSRGLKTVAMGGSQFWCDLYIPADPFRLLDYFYYADYVVTDTFHGAVFSVLNRRPFGVIVRPSNENKLTDLLQRLQLCERRIENMEALPQVLETPVDYEKTEALLRQHRESTRNYLRQQLGVDYGK